MVKRPYAIALACVVAFGIVSAMWIAGRGHEVADPNAFRNTPRVTPIPTLDQRPLRVDVGQRTIAPLPVAESVSHVEPLADALFVVYNHDADAWELRDFSGAHVETLAVSPSIAPNISPDRRRLAHVWGGALVIYDSQARTTITVPRDLDRGADVLWSRQGDRLAVLSPESGGISRLLVVHVADGAVLTEEAWVDGEDVYLEEWTSAGALRVRLWADGGCNPTVLEPCLPDKSTLLESDGPALTSIEAVSADVSYYCGIDVSAVRCVPYRSELDAPAPVANEAIPDEAFTPVTSPDGLYVAVLARETSNALYLRLIQTSDQTFTDVAVPSNDVGLTPTWSPDSRFVYLSGHASCMRTQPRGC